MSCSRGKASPNRHTTLRLFAAAAGLCQKPDCHRSLFVDTGSQNVHMAEMAHLFAASATGPRARAGLTSEELGLFENLILLCSSCHTIVDKALGDFPDELLAEWKRRHVERVAAAFGAVEYSSRQAAREAIEPALAENWTIFKDYGPEQDYKCNPESEWAEVWQRKVRSRILPNNRKLLAILEANRRHLREQELATLEKFRQHVDDLEARHIGEGARAVSNRFPSKMAAILMEQVDG